MRNVSLTFALACTFASAQDIPVRIEAGEVQVEVPVSCTGVFSELAAATIGVSAPGWINVGPSKAGIYQLELHGTNSKYLLAVGKGKEVGLIPVLLPSPPTGGASVQESLDAAMKGLTEERLFRALKASMPRLLKENLVAASTTVVVCLIPGAVGVCVKQGVDNAADAAVVVSEELITVLRDDKVVTSDQALTLTHAIGVVKVVKSLSGDRVDRVLSAAQVLQEQIVESEALSLVVRYKLDGAKKIVAVVTATKKGK